MGSRELILGPDNAVLAAKTQIQAIDDDDDDDDEQRERPGPDPKYAGFFVQRSSAELVFVLPASLSDPAVVLRINDQLELLSLLPSLKADNLDRTLKTLSQWPARFPTDDHVAYAQLVIPTLLRYFHAVYALDTLERRVDAEFLKSAQEQPSFHIISTIRLCVPSACRPERDAKEQEFHSWLFYHLRILQTLQALLTSAPLLSFDSTMCDTIAIDLSDALVKSALTVQTFPSLKAYHPDGVDENKHVFLTLKAHIDSLSEDARAKVNKNLEAVKGMAFFQGGDSD